VYTTALEGAPDGSTARVHVARIQPHVTRDTLYEDGSRYVACVAGNATVCGPDSETGPSPRPTGLCDERKPTVDSWLWQAPAFAFPSHLSAPVDSAAGRPDGTSGVSSPRSTGWTQSGAY
jgi:hypothetical protein